MYIIGGLEDQTAIFVWANLQKNFLQIIDPYITNYAYYNEIFYGLSNPWKLSQPILWTLVSTTIALFGANFYNILMLLTFLLNLWVSSKFFRRFRFWWFYTLVFNLSPHFISHVGKHIDLMQIWVIPLFFIYFYKYHVDRDAGLKDSAKLGLLLTIITLITNYYGFILLIFYLCFYTYKLIVERRGSFVKNTLNANSFFAVFVITTGALLFPYFSQVYINKASDSVQRTDYLNRPYEDFFTFSARPWYFLIPSTKNPLYSQAAINIYEKIEKSGYFLADDYFVYEHSALFFGYSFLAVLIFLVFTRYKFLEREQKYAVKMLLFVLFLVALAAMPPYVTITGFKIYTPGEILYKLFPMFRVTARFGVLMHFVLLIIFGYLLKDLKSKHLKRLMVILTVLVIVETAIPLKIQKIDPPPKIYEYLGKVNDGSTRIYVLPNSRTREAFYYLPVHKTKILNFDKHIYGIRTAQNLEIDEDNFDKGDISKLAENKVDYLVVDNLFLSDNAILNNYEILYFKEYNLVSLNK